MKDFQHEQLFTELTPEQGAVIEGGKTLRLYSIRCLSANADLVGPDDAYFNFGGKIIPIGSMSSNSPKKALNQSHGFEGAPTLTLWDDDPWPNRDDRIDSVGVNGGTGVIVDRLLVGSGYSSGSVYALTYQVLQ